MSDTRLKVPERERGIWRFRLLWNERKLLVVSSFLGIVAAAICSLLVADRYESTAQLMPPDHQPSPGVALIASLASPGIAGIAEDLGIKTTGDLFIGIMRSATVQYRLIDRFDLKKAYKLKYPADVRRKLEQNTTIIEDRKSGIITITVGDTDPSRAAALASGYIEELDRLVIDLSTSSAHRERVFLEERLKTVKNELDNASAQLASFSSQNNALDIKEQGKATIEMAANLVRQVNAAKTELKSLNESFTDENLRVKILKARIGELRRELQKVGGTKALALVDREQPENGSYSSRMLPILGIKYSELYRTAQTQEVLYQRLTQQYELSKVQEVKETPTVKILDPARIPQKRVYPPRLQIMLLGAVLGFIGAVLWVLAVGYWQELAPDDPRRAFAMEVWQTTHIPPGGGHLEPRSQKLSTFLKRGKFNAPASGTTE